MRPRLGKVTGRVLVAAVAMVSVLGGLTPLATLPRAAAASNGDWSIFPYRPPGTFGSGRSIFDFSMYPGQTVTDEATLSNYTTNPIQFEVFPADAYNVERGGGFALNEPPKPNKLVGKWIGLPNALSGIYTVPAGKAANFPFSLTAPKNAAAGDHAGGIVALDVTPVTETRGHTKVQLHRGVGVRVYVHILGPRHPGLIATNIDANAQVPATAWATGSSRAFPTIQVKDTGNTIFNAVKVSSYATDIFGRTVRTFKPKYLEGMLPGNTVMVFEPEWKSLPIAGPVTIHVTLTAKGINQGFSGTFWIIPWLLILIIVALIVLFFLWWRWRRRRRERLAAAAPEPDQPVPTTVG